MPRLYIGAVYIGISGWSYRHWKEGFYKGIAQKNWLKFYATRFSAVEINGTFFANCLSDAHDWPLWDHVTTDLVYIRLHGHTRTYASSYTSPELVQWAERISQWLQQRKQVHVYFDNDAECAAPFNALELKGLFHDKKTDF